ncbi:MAG TPA: SAM-dependent methyltransferase [Casimicrobiaceae bacterium]|nr:SAM-dependent methyltransferase [Casimicrobiaceae bacterium]
MPPVAATTPRPPLAAIALLSAAALGYEILLTRLFSIVLWHHFAYMMISVALLGYGAAGTFVTLARSALLARYERTFVAAAALFGVFAVAGFLLAQQVGFDPLELPWDPRQPLRLLAVYALLLVPFFCAATALCVTFTRFGEGSARIYGADLGGAGAGCLAILALLYAVAPASALLVVGSLGLAAAAVAAATLRGPRSIALALAGAAVVLPLVVPSDVMRLRPSEFKELERTLQIAGTRVLAERSSPLGVVTVVESAQVPFRHAPGLSLNAPAGPPDQLGVFVDGEGPSALVRWDGRPEPLAYLDYLTSALPYHLLARPRVLVLGAGAGADVLQAIALGARTVDAVEQDPLVVDLVERRFAGFSGRPYSAPGVRVQIAEARGFVARSRDRYDLIEVALLDAFGASSAGLYALSESYVYTVEALSAYLDRLERSGMLAVTRWVNLPPRDMLKLFATAVAALERRGVAAPGRQLALIRSWSTATLLVKNSAFTAGEIAALREFCRTRSFDADWFPGIAPGEANRFNVLDPSQFEDGASALLGPERAAFIERYKFAIEPATDDRPYFFRFFRWRTLPEVLALKDRGGLPLLDWGYPVLIATLAQAAVVGAILILLPLAFARRGGTGGASVGGPSRSRVALYFGAIGFAFMFVEIAFIQKFTLFLAHPLYAVAVVLFAFLVFAALGSRWSARFRADGKAHPAALAAAAIGVISLAYLAALPPLFAWLLPLPDGARVAISIALVAPLAFAMGVPFPSGLARLAPRASALVPWAWGLNACASVVAAVLATLLAIHFGFAVVVLLAVLLYGVAAAAWR